MTVKYHGVTVSKDRLADVLKTVKELTGQQVLVGIPQETAGRQPEPGEKGLPPSNAVIGYIMETGSPEENIPARPFLVTGIEGARDGIIQQMRRGGENALSGDKDAVSKTMHAAGLLASSSVKKKIDAGPFAPLAPRTLAERKARGRTGEKPLIDTGQLRKSVTYVIRPRGK